MATLTSTDPDVLILGAGPTGAVTAKRFVEAGMSVVVLDQGDWPDYTIGPTTSGCALLFLAGVFLLAPVLPAAEKGVRVEDAALAGTRNTHWSLQPLKAPAVPGQGRHASPIDEFILARLATNGLALSPPADRPTLIRRLSFDLIGLPPSPREIDEFVRNKSPHACEELVERLLGSPRYGERWGRHWLDVARYTESQGFEYDRLRTNAWHYRDYVIRSFNDDKPYDRFMKEQMAGDVLKPVTSEGIIGASLLVCGPWDQAGNSQANATQKAITREDELEDMLGVVGQTFLGLTLNCARCHSHKFDPIPHEEYYRIKSIFEGVKHGERSIASPGELEAREKRIGILSNAVSYVGTRVQPKPTRLLKRGDVNSPDEIVTPGALSAIVDLNPDFGLAADAPEAERRLKFAEWVADPRNPLPARVMVNRVWHHHFGQGLVATPNDFGASGARPSHPELLDWLAVKFIESGWSVKALHRLIVNSETYRQSSLPSVISNQSGNSNQSGRMTKPGSLNTGSLKTDYYLRATALDADNQLLWRYTPRRLEAEALRDAMLAVSGQIHFEMGGPGFRPFTVASFNSDFYQLKDMVGPEFNRRTVYRMNVNSGKDPLLDAFDCPDPSVKTPRRGVTTTPLQGLALMNNSFVQRQAAEFAARALREANHDLSGAVQAAYRLALGRAPTGAELKRAVAAAKERGLAGVCWALLNSTEFVYVQ